MNEAERNRDLCKKYPFLLPYRALAEDDEDWFPRTDRISPDFDYSCTMLDFVPKGWRERFLQLCDELLTALDGTDELYRFRFIEIKEKYGELRMYATGGNRETDVLIDRCERDTDYICVECGKNAVWISRGWICPYCDDCIGYRSHSPVKGSD